MVKLLLYNRFLIITTVRSLLLLLFTFLMSTNNATAQDDDVSLPFQVGERLVYRIYWGPFLVGRASLEVSGIEKVDGHECYHLIARARTSGLAEFLYPIDSATESWFDKSQLFTRRYRENRIEGDHRRNREVCYDYDHGFLSVTNLANSTAQQFPLTQPVQDVISTLYFMRTQPMTLHDKSQFIVNSSDKNYDVTLKPDFRKTIALQGVGKLSALRMEPDPPLNIVSSNKGRMWLWVSDDERRLPLVLASTMKIGSAKLVLSKIEKIQPIPTLDFSGPDQLNETVGPVAAGHQLDEFQK